MKSNITKSSIAIIIWLGVQQSTAQIMSQGPMNPHAVTIQYAGCLSCPGAEWLNAANAMLPDSVYAAVWLWSNPNCFMSSCYYARGLQASDFGFSVPGNATVTGIIADASRKGQTSSAIWDSSIFLLKNGLPEGVPKTGPNAWPLLPQYETYGDSSDLWGASLTPADVNSSQFGVMVKPMNKSTASDSAFVDHIRLTVFYTLPVSVDENYFSEYAFYFDATSQSIIINVDDLKNTKAEMRVFDYSGRMVLRKKVSERVEVNGLSPGIYTAVIFREQIKLRLKFSVQ